MTEECNKLPIKKIPLVVPVELKSVSDIDIEKGAFYISNIYVPENVVL